jgi:ketopantoate reductase
VDSSLSTIPRVSLGELIDESNAELVKATIKEILDEIILIARTSGVHTGTMLEDEAADIVRRTKPSDYKFSMLVDLEANRPTEMEMILGEVVRKAA